jgi:hypothetical protein
MDYSPKEEDGYLSFWVSVNCPFEINERASFGVETHVSMQRALRSECDAKQNPVPKGTELR